MPLANLLAEAPKRGIRGLGVTDHLQTPYNLPDIEACRREFDALKPPPNVHFGIEVSVVSQWELEELAKGTYENPVWGLREGGPAGGPLAIGMAYDDIERLGIEYVVGGAHWVLYTPYEREAVIRDYHRQNMFLATHPLVDIVAHPWWWQGHWQDEDGRYTTDPWLADFGVIPQSMHDEFAAAARQHGKAVEINIGAMVLAKPYPERFKQQYLYYLAGLQAAGVTLSIGSDVHGEHYDRDFERAEELLTAAGISDEGLWGLEPRS